MGWAEAMDISYSHIIIKISIIQNWNLWSLKCFKAVICLRTKKKMFYYIIKMYKNCEGSLSSSRNQIAIKDYLKGTNFWYAYK